MILKIALIIISNCASFFAGIVVAALLAANSRGKEISKIKEMIIKEYQDENKD